MTSAPWEPVPASVVVNGKKGKGKGKSKGKGWGGAKGEGEPGGDEGDDEPNEPVAQAAPTPKAAPIVAPTPKAGQLVAPVVSPVVVGSPMKDRVETFIANNGIDAIAAEGLRNATTFVQMRVLGSGDIKGGSNPSGILVSRLRKAHREEIGRPDGV